MEKLKQDTAKYFKAALTLSLLVPVGVLGIVFGAILATWYGWIMLGVGAAICLAGFYVMPVLWVTFGEYKKLQRIAVSITDENVYYIDMLAQRFQMTPRQTCDAVRKLIAKRYIEGYVFNNNRFVMKLQQRTVSVHCPNCGSNVNVYGADGICEHCGTLVKNPNKKVVHATTRSYYKELIDAGIEIYEYSEGFIHAKTFVSDDRIAVIGTTNLDFRSLYLHFECGAVAYDEKIAAAVKEDFENVLAVSQQISAESCKAGLFKRIWQALLRLFAPLM